MRAVQAQYIVLSLLEAYRLTKEYLIKMGLTPPDHKHEEAQAQKLIAALGGQERSIGALHPILDSWGVPDRERICATCGLSESAVKEKGCGVSNNHDELSACQWEPTYLELAAKVMELERRLASKLRESHNRVKPPKVMEDNDS